MQGVFFYGQVDDLSRFRTFKMGVRREVRAVAGGSSIKIYFLNKSTFYKCLQAIVDGGKGNLR